MVLKYLDSCPQSYHMLCLDPPMRKEDIPEENWFCPHCKIAKAPPAVPSKGGRGAQQAEIPFRPVAAWKEGGARIKNVCKCQSCMVSKLRIISSPG